MKNREKSQKKKENLNLPDGQNAKTFDIHDMASLRCAAIESSINGIVFSDLKGKILYANESFLKMTGRNKEDIYGQSSDKLPMKNEILNGIKKALSKGSWTGEICCNNGKNPKSYMNVLVEVVKDETGRPLCIAASHSDITKQKLIEESLKDKSEKLDKIVKEKTVLETKIKDYAKQLERKIKTLEDDRIPLTKKERLVLWGLCAYPIDNDEELSKKLGLKRTTVTSIRNRLKQEGWYSIFNLPNFSALGCELFAGLRCEFKDNISEKERAIFKQITNLPEIVLNVESGNICFGIFASEKYCDMLKFVNETSGLKNKISLERTVPFPFFYELTKSSLNSPFFLSHILKLNVSSKEQDLFVKSEVTIDELNMNEKKVLCALAEYPEAGINEIANKAGVSNPTASKIKKELFEKRIISPFVFVDFKKLPINFLSVLTIKYNPNDFEKVSQLAQKSPETKEHVIFRIIGKEEILYMIASREDEYKQEVSKLENYFNKNSVDIKSEIFTFPFKSASVNKVDFASLTKKIVLGEKRE